MHEIISISYAALRRNAPHSATQRNAAPRSATFARIESARMEGAR